VPLSIELKPREKIFINGAVLANGEGRTHFFLLNDAAILRERDVMTEAGADTPCKRVYFSIQSMYMDPDNQADYLSLFVQFTQAVRQAATSAEALLDAMESQVAAGKLYQALKTARKLIDYEEELLNHVR